MGHAMGAYYIIIQATLKNAISIPPDPTAQAAAAGRAEMHFKLDAIAWVRVAKGNALPPSCNDLPAI